MAVAPRNQPIAPCSLLNLTEPEVCFNCADISEHELEVLKVWFLYKLYEADGGTMPTLNQLLSTLACYQCKSDKEIRAMEVAALRYAASQAGATVDDTDVADLTTSQLREQIKCWLCGDPKLFRVAKMYGLCVILDRLTEPVL